MAAILSRPHCVNVVVVWLDSNLPQTSPEQVPPHVVAEQTPCVHGVVTRFVSCLYSNKTNSQDACGLTPW